MLKKTVIRFHTLCSFLLLGSGWQEITQPNPPQHKLAVLNPNKIVLRARRELCKR